MPRQTRRLSTQEMNDQVHSFVAAYKAVAESGVFDPSDGELERAVSAHCELHTLGWEDAIGFGLRVGLVLGALTGAYVADSRAGTGGAASSAQTVAPDGGA